MKRPHALRMIDRRAPRYSSGFHLGSDLKLSVNRSPVGGNRMLGGTDPSLAMPSVDEGDLGAEEHDQ
jgi:hypothetical protein